MGDDDTKKLDPRQKTLLLNKGSKSLHDPIPTTLTKQQKQFYVQQRLYSFQKMGYGAIKTRFAPTLEMIANGGTLRQAAFASGVSVPELMHLLEFGRFGGSKAWTQFWEEFFRAKSKAEAVMMKHLFSCAEAGEKWAIQRMMNIAAPEEFGVFDEIASEKVTPGGPMITQNIYTVKSEYSERDITDTEYEEDGAN